MVAEASQSPPLAKNIDQLIDFFREGGKSRSRWRVGTEHEMCGVTGRAFDAPAYGGRIGALLERLTEGGWSPVVEAGTTIGLERGDTAITLEPGGQFEHAARPLASAAALEEDVEQFFRELKKPCHELDLSWLALGIRPFGELDAIPWMPKGRYKIMRDYLPTRGSMALHMMKRTATVQVNLDFADEADAVRKMRCSLSITSLLTALYANSAIVGGKVSGFQSYRGEIWRHTDNDRCGFLPFVFDRDDLFRAYAEWALDVPMFFVYRASYLPAHGVTFRQFMVEGFEGHLAHLDDWALHLSTLFPEARMKRFIEVRGCDTGPVPMILALAPLVAGILYDDDATEAATALTAGLDIGQREQLQADVARSGLRAKLPGSGLVVGELVREMVEISRASLARFAPENVDYLAPVEEIAATGRTLADAAIDAFESANGDPAVLVPKWAHPWPDDELT